MADTFGTTVFFLNTTYDTVGHTALMCLLLSGAPDTPRQWPPFVQSTKYDDRRSCFQAPRLLAAHWFLVSAKMIEPTFLPLPRTMSSCPRPSATVDTAAAHSVRAPIRGDGRAKVVQMNPRSDAGVRGVASAERACRSCAPRSCAERMCVGHL